MLNEDQQEAEKLYRFIKSFYWTTDRLPSMEHIHRYCGLSDKALQNAIILLKNDKKIDVTITKRMTTLNKVL